MAIDDVFLAFWLVWAAVLLIVLLRAVGVV